MTKQELTYEFSKRYLEFITLNFSPNELMAMWRAKQFSTKAKGLWSERLDPQNLQINNTNKEVRDKLQFIEQKSYSTPKKLKDVSTLKDSIGIISQRPVAELRQKNTTEGEKWEKKAREGGIENLHWVITYNAVNQPYVFVRAMLNLQDKSIVGTVLSPREKFGDGLFGFTSIGQWVIPINTTVLKNVSPNIVGKIPVIITKNLDEALLKLEKEMVKLEILVMDNRLWYDKLLITIEQIKIDIEGKHDEFIKEKQDTTRYNGNGN